MTAWKLRLRLEKKTTSTERYKKYLKRLKNDDTEGYEKYRARKKKENAEYKAKQRLKRIWALGPIESLRLF